MRYFRDIDGTQLRASSGKVASSMGVIKLAGRVCSGLGDASRWIALLARHYREKTGLDLYPGTLNVQLEVPYAVPVKPLRLEGAEYGGRVSVSIVPCEVFGRKAFVLRTDLNEAGKGPHPLTLIEIATDVSLRATYGLQDGDRVEVLFEPQHVGEAVSPG